MHQFVHRADLAAERQPPRAAEEQALVHVAFQRLTQFLVDAELAPVCIAVAQAAVRQAVEPHVAVRLDARLFLQLRFVAQVLVQPGRAHRTGRKAGDTGEFDDVFGRGLGQHALEFGMGIALQRNGECGAQLHRRGAQTLQPADVVQTGDAARGDQRNASFETGRAEEGHHFGQHHFEVETVILQIGHLGGAEVATGQPRVLDDDGVGQAALLFPLAHHQLDAAQVRQDWNQGDLRVIAAQLGQVQRQACAHHDGVDPRNQCLAHIVFVFAHGPHDVDRDHAPAAGQLAGPRDLTVERLQIGGVHPRPGIGLPRHVGGAGHQVRVMPAQVDRGDGSDAAQAGHGAREASGRDADAHAALNDRQQGLAAQLPGPKA